MVTVDAPAIEIVAHPMQVRLPGEETRLVIGTGDLSSRPLDMGMVKAIARGRRWYERLTSGQVS